MRNKGKRQKAKGKSKEVRSREEGKNYLIYWIVEENRNLSDRLLEFSIRVIKFLRKVENTIEFKAIKYQLIKAATSSGANYEEAQGAASKPDFINKIRIALKEMREANYWLLVLNGVLENKSLKPELIELIDESEELKKILGSICKKASINKNR